MTRAIRSWPNFLCWPKFNLQVNHFNHMIQFLVNIDTKYKLKTMILKILCYFYIAQEKNL